MRSDGTNNYAYDAEYRISCMNPDPTTWTCNQNSLSYTYDADGRRVRKSTGTNYWYGPTGQPLGETDSGGNWTFYIFFAGKRLARNVPQPTSADIKYYITDHLHSTAMFVDKAGTTAAIIDDNDFYPWGGMVPGVGKTTSSNTVKFTGHYCDSESQLDYMGARYYANVMGRFMTPDWAAKPTSVPYAEFGDPQSLNLYSYVRNHPITQFDPDGHTLAGWSSTGNTWMPSAVGSVGGDAGNEGSDDDRYDVTKTTTTTTVTYSDGSSQTLTQTSYTAQKVGSAASFDVGYSQTRTSSLTFANYKPWEMRSSVVDFLKTKNPCTDWLNSGAGSALNIMSNVPIFFFNPKSSIFNEADARTYSDDYSPIWVNTKGRFYEDSTNGLPLGGVYPAGSFRARMIIMLHELAHKVNLIPHDGELTSPPGQSDKNTATVMSHCEASLPW